MHTISRAERVRALVFLAIGLLLIAGVCGLLIGLPLLRNTRQYFVRFTEPVAGISKGSEVKYQGVKKGRVKRYTIDYDIIQFELEMDADLHVTDTTVALITSEGILPPYFIELRGSVRGSPELPEGSVIKTDPSMSATIRQRGMEIADSFQAVLKNLERWTGPENEQKLRKLLDEASSALATANQTVTTIRPEAERLVRAYADAGDELAKLISENRETIRTFLDESRKMAAELNRFLASGKLDQMTAEAAKTFESVRSDFNRASAAFSKFLDDTRIDERLGKVVAALERAEKDLGQMTGSVQSEMSGLAQGELLPALRSFREAMASFNDLARVLRDDPSLVIFSRPRPEIRIPAPGEK